MTQLYANNAFGTLSQPLAADGTSLVLQAGEGARFPLPSGGDFFLVTLAELNDVNNEIAWEIRRCTARVGDTLTVTQAQEGTTPRAWVAGTRVDLRDTAGTLAGMAEKAALGTAAAKDVQTSLTDTTPGRLMTVEAFGIGTTAASSVKPSLNPQSVSEWDQPVGSHWFIMTTAVLLPEPGYFNATVIARRDMGDVITWLAANYGTGQTFIGTADFTAGTLVWRKLWDSVNLDPASFATAAQGAKADTALQSETDPTVPAWAKAASKPAYTKSEVGLGEVDNTSDVNKPVSTAQQAALDLKAALSGGAAANFAAMPQVGGSPIVESGSNANGYWTKWADGTMICTGAVITATAASSAALDGGGGAVGITPVPSFLYPAGFIAVPFAKYICSTIDGQGANLGVAEYSAGSVNAPGSAYIVGQGRSNAYNVTYCSIGRWK